MSQSSSTTSTGITFDTATGLTAPSTAEIREQIRADFVSAFTKAGSPTLNTEPETPAGQLIDSLTAIIAEKNAEILFLANQFNPLTAEGVWQAALGKIYFLTPKTASASVATCTCQGLQGTVISEGSIIQSTADQTQWIALGDVTIPSSGKATVEFQCSETGPIEAAAGSLTKIITVTPGWDSVTNAVATVGSNAETQVAFERRRYDSVAVNAMGSMNALYSALSSIDGVIDVNVLENTESEAKTMNGVSVDGHSVYITISGGKESDIAEVIYRKKDAGCGTCGNTIISYTDTSLITDPECVYKIERPIEKSIGFFVTINKTDDLPNDYATLIKEAIVEDFTGEGSNLRCGTCQTIYASRFYPAVINAGISDVVSVTIKNITDGGSYGNSVVINADSEPVISEDNIIITVNE